MVKGLNRVSLIWPSLTRDGDVALGEVIERLEKGVAGQIHPIFGEVFSIKARLIAETDQTR